MYFKKDGVLRNEDYPLNFGSQMALASFMETLTGLYLEWKDVLLLHL